MDTEFYEELAELAVELLEKFAATVTLRSFSPGGGGKYNPATGKAVSNSQTATKDEDRFCMIGYAPANRIGPLYGSNKDHGTLIQDGNKWCWLDPDGIGPTTKHHLIVGKKTYQFSIVHTYAPGGIAL